LFEQNFVVLLKSAIVCEVLFVVIVLEERGPVTRVLRMVYVSEVVNEVFKLSPDVIFLFFVEHIYVPI